MEPRYVNSVKNVYVCVASLAFVSTKSEQKSILKQPRFEFQMHKKQQQQNRISVYILRKIADKWNSKILSKQQKFFVS